MRCKCFAYGPADATATPSSLASVNPDSLPFGCQLTKVVLEKRPLNGCSSVLCFNIVDGKSIWPGLYVTKQVNKEI